MKIAVVSASPRLGSRLPSGLFKSYFDVLPEDYLRGKPVAIGARGGTPRHSLFADFTPMSDLLSD